MTRNETRVHTAALIESYLKKGGQIQKVPMAKPGRRQGKTDEQKIAELEAEIQRLKSA